MLAHRLANGLDWNVGGMHLAWMYGNAEQARINNFPENGRGLGHVTPTSFGGTVGYPSDSLASC